ncbi:hypothetical protein L6164_037000 [Bauhinia variegata]|uniref:Uncharacterized protein n=1 Tax=Bauhinia variegata TaxID=167791 RepID=A0ACB9KIQ0_BAUVA|nr:hypothetical protein L6164_037000 [Bauhinia variegata]
MWNKERNSPARCFLTPPPTWKSRPLQAPAMPLSERKRSSPADKGDIFHVVHKIPSGDSPYVKAKKVQLVDKDPGRAISMFWAAINAGDRVESALKDMALVMKQMDRSDEAIEAIKSFRHRCPSDSQESLDNILVELYKRSGRIDEEIAMLEHKLKQIEEGGTFVGKRTKQGRSQGKKIQITIEQDISRILGNLAWAYLQKGDYETAEKHYRTALSFEPDKNKQCNLAICLMFMNRITEAKFLLQAVRASCKNKKMDDSFNKSFERASQMLAEKESLSTDKHCKESFSQNFHENMPRYSPETKSAVEWKKGSNVEKSCGNRSELVRTMKENWSLTSEERLYERHARKDLNDSYAVSKRSFHGFNNGYQRSESWGDCSSDHKSGPLNDRFEFVQQNSGTGLPSPANRMWRRRERMQGDSAILKQEDTAVACFDSLPTIDSQSQPYDMPLSNSAVSKYFSNNMINESLTGLHEFQSANEKETEKKSWADMVEEEEEEEELLSQRYTNFDDQYSEEVFNDENQNSNIIYQSPFCQRPTEYLSQKLETFDLKDGYNSPGNSISSRNPTVRRSLCFNQKLTPESADHFCTASPKKASNFEDSKVLARDQDSVSGEKKLTSRRRLQVFRDITLDSGSP